MLLKEKPPLIKPIGEAGGETRYDIADRSLADYIADCWALFSFVQWRLEETWKFRRKPTKGEVERYVFFTKKGKQRISLQRHRKMLENEEKNFRLAKLH
jgi:hypothetical protein